MTDIRERLARAIDPDAGWDDPVPVSYHSKGAHLEGAKASEAFRRIDRAYSRAQAVLAQLPLTEAQLDGLASGNMVVVPRDITQLSGWAVTARKMPLSTVELVSTCWQAMISAAQEEQP